MNNELSLLLKKYEQKRAAAIYTSNKLKEDLFNKYPELEKLDNDISSFSVKKIQLILTSQDKEEINKIDQRINKLKQEKINFLTKYNINLDDYQPKFECTKCNDTGYVSTSEGNVMCSCIKQQLYNVAYNNSNIYDLENQNFDNFRLDVYSTNVDPKSKFKLSPQENMKKIKKTCEQFIENFDDPKQMNLLFCGNTGLGKTFLSSCVANELIKQGKTVLYQTAPIMLDKIIDYKFGKTTDNISKSIYSADLLIIDDLGTETKNSLKVTELFNIINSRLLNQDNKVTKTIISTNLSLQDMYNTYEERIVSRIIGNYNACYFYGDDIRIKKRLATK